MDTGAVGQLVKKGGLQMPLEDDEEFGDGMPLQKNYAGFGQNPSQGIRLALRPGPQSP